MSDDRINIYRVPARLLPDLWPAIAPHAVAACEHHPFLDAEDLLQILLAGRGQLFLVTCHSGQESGQEGVFGFAVMEVLQYPSCRVANLLAAGGERGFLGVLTGELLEELKRWSAEQGAVALSAMGRPGWARVASRLGWHVRESASIWTEFGHGLEGRRTADNGLGAVDGGTALPS